MAAPRISYNPRYIARSFQFTGQQDVTASANALGFALKNLHFLVPIGTVQQYAGSAVPETYLFCNGAAIPRLSYRELFGVIGTTYGPGDGSTTFNLPDLRARIPVGLDSSTPYATPLAYTGGEEKHALTIGEMPAHKHGSVDVTGNTNGDGNTTSSGVHTHIATDAGHTHTYLGVSGQSSFAGLDTAADEANRPTETTSTGYADITVQTAGAHIHTMGSTGGGQTHNNLQPYIVLNYIIKFA